MVSRPDQWKSYSYAGAAAKLALKANFAAMEPGELLHKS
jgi:hypothetical protein